MAVSALTNLVLFFNELLLMLRAPFNIALLFGSVALGIFFGAAPGLTATLGVALLTTLTYRMSTEVAILALLGMYVGAIYGGSYSSILINIPGTAAAAATAMDGYPLACQGKAGKALGITTTSSFIGTLVGMIFVAAFTPLICRIALNFTSFEFFLLAFFGIMISGTLGSEDLAYKGWISGFLGLFLACMGRDQLQFYPRFTFGIPELDGGIDVVPALIGAFGIPQIIEVLRKEVVPLVFQEVRRVTPELRELLRHLPTAIRSALIGVGIGAIPGVGEDIAAWTAYGVAKNASKHPERYGKGEIDGVVASESANNACIGGAIIPLLSLGIPGSPPAAMLLGALLLHGVQPGPMLTIDHPTFIPKVTAALFLNAFGMFVVGMLLVKQVIKLLKIPQVILMAIVGVLCVIGSYAIGLRIFNLYLMLPIGLLAYCLTKMKYPIAPLVIGVILGPMADANLRRALMVSGGSFLPIFTRPVALVLFLATVFMAVSQVSWVKSWLKRLRKKVPLLSEEERYVLAQPNRKE
jgi:putative tricarboxylic transport membrane protein